MQVGFHSIRMATRVGSTPNVVKNSMEQLASQLKKAEEMNREQAELKSKLVALQTQLTGQMEHANQEQARITGRLGELQQDPGGCVEGPSVQNCRPANGRQTIHSGYRCRLRSVDSLKALRDTPSPCDVRYDATAMQAGVLLMAVSSLLHFPIKAYKRICVRGSTNADSESRLVWRVVIGTNEITATEDTNESLESGRLQFVLDPRVFGSDEFRGALRWIKDGESSDMDWSSARFIIADPATRRLRVVTNIPTKSPCASWSCTLAAGGGQDLYMRLWSDCPLPGRDSDAATRPPRGGVIGLRHSTQRLELFPLISHADPPPDDATVNWDLHTRPTRD